MDHKEIKKGIKRVELDRNVYNISIFFAMFFGIVVGSSVGLIANNGWAGLAAGVAVFFAMGISAANKYYENEDDE